MTDNFHDAVYATLLYAAIFTYPLTEKEISRWLIFFKDKKNHFREKKNSILCQIPCIEGYYGVSSSRLKRFIKKRIARKQAAIAKWEIAHKAIRLLRYIPSVKLIGVSGGLAMNNCDDNDDIDLFFIVAPRTIWISRLFVLLVLECIGKRRTFDSREEKDLVCANMFLSEDQLSVLSFKRDLYSAHEVMQMVPLFEREGCYRRFIQANVWARSYLPNAWKWRFGQVESKKYQDNTQKFFSYFLLPTFYFLEFFAKWFQMVIMKKHITRETISDTALQFHPKDARSIIKKRFMNALKQYNIPIDSKFFPGYNSSYFNRLPRNTD
jgi:hypothetical protein